MAEFWVTNSLNPHKAVKFNITLRYFISATDRGEHVWLLEVGTTYPDPDGNPIPSKKVHLISVNNFDEAIQNAVAFLCAKIDWSPFVSDVEAPFVFEYAPTGSDVGIYRDINITLKDNLPSAGIDLSSMKITLNNSVVDFDITSEVQVIGDPYIYELKWTPPLRVYNTYD